MDNAVLKLNAELLRNQFAIGSSKAGFAGRIYGFNSLHLQRADGEPYRVCRANLRQNELARKVAIASGCVGVTRGRDYARYHERENSSDPPEMVRTSSAMLVAGRSVFHTHPHRGELLKMIAHLLRLCYILK